MSDSPDGSSFLETTGDLAGVPWDAATGVSWSRVGVTIIASIVTTFALGIQSVISAVTTAWTSVLGGLETFIAGGQRLVYTGVGVIDAGQDGLFDVTAGVGIAAARGAWSFALDEYGLLAFPVAGATVLATFYVLNIGTNWVTERYL